MIKLTCLSFIYLNVCNRVCNNVYSHAICSTLRALFLFSVVLFRVRNCLLLLLKNEDVQIYQDDCPEIYFIKYKLIDMNIHSSVKVIPCTIYLNLSKDTKFGSRHNEQVKERTTQHNWSFVCEYGYSINKRQANSSTRISSMFKHPNVILYSYGQWLINNT